MRMSDWSSDVCSSDLPVDHRPVTPAVGYRFDYKGRSVVLSGDTGPSAMVERAAKGADLLIHEALQPDMVQTLADDLKAAGRAQTGQIMHDILDYHARDRKSTRLNSSH